MGTKVLIPSHIMALNGNNVLAITGFAHQTIEDLGNGTFLVELQKTLTAQEKTTMTTTITSKVANFKEV